MQTVDRLKGRAHTYNRIIGIRWGVVRVRGARAARRMQGVIPVPALERAKSAVQDVLASPALERAKGAVQAQLPTLRSERWQAAYVVLWLVEAFVVTSMILGFVNTWATPEAPDEMGLDFAAIVLVPSLLLAVHWKYRAAKAEERRTAEERRLREARTRARGGDLARAYALLYLQVGAPLHIAQAAYTAAMKRAHPDVAGGSARRAAELNWAIETIRRRYQNQLD